MRVRTRLGPPGRGDLTRWKQYRGPLAPSFSSRAPARAIAREREPAVCFRPVDALDLSAGFPVLTTKKLHLRSIIVELLWFLRGETNVRYLGTNTT